MTIDTHGRAHKPAGSPASTGGQYAPQATPNQAASLGAEQRPWIDEDARGWGNAATSVGGRSPWGEIDSVSAVAPGIVFASTASHGGYRLSPERNQFVPSRLRQMNRWYEEDTAFAIIARTFPGAMRADSRDSVGAILEEADETIRGFVPHLREQITGRTLQHGESRMRPAAERAYGPRVAEAATIDLARGEQRRKPAGTPASRSGQFASRGALSISSL